MLYNLYNLNVLWLISFILLLESLNRFQRNTCGYQTIDFDVLEDEFRARVVEMENQSILLREENSELRKNGKNSNADNP